MSARGASRRGTGWVLATALGLALGVQSTDSLACTYAPDPPWTLDATQVGVDVQPPQAPQVQSGEARRGKGSVCDADGRCVVSSCGDWGNVFVDLQGLEPGAELGYRLQVVEGSVPLGFESILQETRTGGSSLLWRGAFDEVVALNATFELIAIDRAGNESVPSESFEIAFDGCTRSPLDLEDCLEERLPPGAPISSEEPVVLGTGGSAGCSVAQQGSRSGAGLYFLLCCLAWALCAARRFSSKRAVEASGHSTAPSQ